MAQDIRQDVVVTGSSVSITLNNLADGSSATSTSEDLGGGTPITAVPFALSLTAILDGLAGGTDLVEIYAQWSNDNFNFSDVLNDQLIAVVQMDTTNEVIKIVSVPVVARYLKLRVENNSGAALAAAGNSLAFWPVTVDQA